MDKPLSDINKDNDSGKKDGVSQTSPASRSAAPVANIIKTTVDGYSPDLSYKNWEESKKNLRWDTTPQGRAVIRLFSRGGLGAAAFAAGSWYIGRGNGMKGYSSAMKLSEISPSKPLHYVAKSIDTVFGKPIKFTAEMLGKSPEAAEDFVRFRPTRDFVKGEKGRSLGHEAVSITFDFFCASVGDAIGRDIASILDPHVKHDWKDDKGHIKYPEAIKTGAKSLWRYVSYNGGEDWAVSVPYSFFMRGQRNLINRYSKGFGYDSDRGLNGGSFKVNKSGDVVGNYNMAGILDLQGRFTAYNVGTLMYREAYNNIANKISGKETVLYGSASEKHGKKQSVGEKIGELFKWTARSVVKGVIYMTPAVPFFSVFRTSQSKYRGLFINPDDNSVLGYEKNKAENKYDAVHANELRRTSEKSLFKFDKDGKLPDVAFRALDKTGLKFETVDHVINHPLSSGRFDAYGQGEGNSLINAIGRGQNTVRSKANDLLVGRFGTGSKRNVDSYVNAAFAYTPYMYAKGEAARLWDSGRMDAAAERMIDGAAKLDYREFKAGASEVWRTVINKPFSDKAREEYAIRRIREDESPADNLTKEQAYLDALNDISRSPLSWRQRIIHGRPPEKTGETPQSEKPNIEKQSSYTEQEAMRKALNELQPPTNSIH